MFLRRGVLVPVEMQVRIVFVNVRMLTSEMGMSGREFFAEPFGDAREVQHAEKDQHQADGKLHAQTNARWNHQIEEDDGGADDKNGQRVAYAIILFNLVIPPRVGLSMEL